MKNIKLLYLFVVATLAACGEYYGYDADTAKTPYQPMENVRLVKSLKTTNMLNGKEYSWVHEFEYDTKNRIKCINSDMVHYREVSSAGMDRLYLCNISSNATYYYMGEDIDVKYFVSWTYPEKPEWNSDMNGTDKGSFNSSGCLKRFTALDFEYSGSVLTKAYADGDSYYEITRNGNNVTGYRICDTYSGEVKIDMGGKCKVSSFKNNTNFDFTGYFGYWGLETELLANATPYYAAYQLAAFGMLGTVSPNLPLGAPVVGNDGVPMYGKWTLDADGYPLVFVDATGRKTEVTYVE